MTIQALRKGDYEKFRDVDLSYGEEVYKFEKESQGQRW
jgi:hypothetical protein